MSPEYRSKHQEQKQIKCIKYKSPWNYGPKKKNESLTLQPNPKESLRKKNLRSETNLSKSSKMPVIPLLPNAPHQTMGHSHPNSSIPMPPKLSLPTSQQLHHCFRHNPVSAKQSKHHRPQIKSNRAMDKEVVYWFPISFAHTTPIQNQNQNIPQSCNPNKKSNSRKDLRLPNSLPREKTSRNFLLELGNKMNSKTSSRSKFPTHLIIPSSSQRSSINSRH